MEERLQVQLVRGWVGGIEVCGWEGRGVLRACGCREAPTGIPESLLHVSSLLYRVHRVSPQHHFEERRDFGEELVQLWALDVPPTVLALTMHARPGKRSNQRCAH